MKEPQRGSRRHLLGSVQNEQCIRTRTGKSPAQSRMDAGFYWFGLELTAEAALPSCCKDKCLNKRVRAPVFFSGASEGFPQPLHSDRRAILYPIAISRVSGAMTRDGITDVFGTLDGTKLVFNGVT